MFARHLTPYEAERAERERIRRKAPHLALVDHVPAPAKAPEPDHFAWSSLADLLPINGEDQ
jgi:hypothetical protein